MAKKELRHQISGSPLSSQPPLCLQPVFTLGLHVWICWQEAALVIKSSIFYQMSGGNTGLKRRQAGRLYPLPANDSAAVLRQELGSSGFHHS